MANGFDSTLGGSGANSYCSLDVANAYALRQVWGDDWLAIAQEQRERLLMVATKWLETLPYKGDRCNSNKPNPVNRQNLSWPRRGASCDGIVSVCDFIPQDIIQAEVELAYQFHLDPTAMSGDGKKDYPDGVYIKRNKLGDLEQEFAEFTGSKQDCSGCDTPKIISKFSFLRDFLSCYLATNFSSSKILLRRRS